MKMMKPAVLILALFAAAAVQAQKKTSSLGYLDFESQPAFQNPSVYRDTVSNPACIWEIGTPMKPILDSANSSVRVIMTDTANAYPPFDTSSFILFQTAWGGWVYDTIVGLQGFYSVNSDTLVDYGSIEISVNQGASWIDILTDTQYNFFDANCLWPGSSIPPRPILTGNSFGWQPFAFSFCELASAAQLAHDDTVLIRFTFRSDGIHTGKDGLMFDDLFVMDWFEQSVGQGPATMPSKVFPNPAAEQVHISTPYPYRTAQVILTDLAGRRVGEWLFSQGAPADLPLKMLAAGLYQYRMVFDGGKAESRGKLVKQ